MSNDVCLSRRELLVLAAGLSAAGGFAAPGGARAVVFNVEKFATHDGPGIRTVVFLKGCPLRCRWCHSPESWSYRIERYPGGEPLAQSDFCVEFLAKLKAAGVSTAIETSGFAAESVIERLLPYVDLWLYDVKELDAERYLAYTTRPLAPSLANLRRINRAFAARETGGVVLRCPMIPGLNDDAAALRRIGSLADELDSVSRVDVEPYVPYGVDKAKRLGLKVYEAPQPPAEYGPAKVAELAKHTKKKVVLG